MEVKYLNDDELDIEFEVRNLVDAGNGVTETLKLRLDELFGEEKDGQSIVPTTAHKAALKNPKREILNISKKMDTILQKILLQDPAGDLDKDNIKESFNTMMAQILHIGGRLGRIATSNVIKKKLPELYRTQQKIFKVVQDVLSGDLGIVPAMVAAAEIIVPLEGGEKDAGTANPQPEDDDVFIDSDNRKPKPSTSDGVTEAVGEIGEELGGKRSFKNTLVHLKQELEDQLAQFDDAEEKQNVSAESARRIKNGSEVSEESVSEVEELLLPLDAKICRDPSTWGLKFEGTKSTMHVERFFYRVERMARKSKISLDGLVNYMSLLLSGEALEWFWTYLERNNRVTWDMLKNEMIQRFQASRSDDDVRRMLGQRKQMYPRESFLDFHDAIIKIALQSKRTITDQEIYNYLRRNMRPGLQLELFEMKNFPTVSHFVRKCVSLEDLWRRFGVNPESKLSVQHQGYSHNTNNRDNYNSNNNNNRYSNYSRENRFQPRLHEISEERPVCYEDEHDPLEEEYEDYEGQDNQICAMYTNNRNGRFQRDNRPPPRHFQQPSAILKRPEGPRMDKEPKTLTCWNCSDTGHTFFDCRTPVRHVFCYGCGTKGVYKPDCLKCKFNSENYKPELRNSRESQLVTGARSKTTMIQNLRQTDEAAANTDPELYRKQ